MWGSGNNGVHGRFDFVEVRRDHETTEQRIWNGGKLLERNEYEIGSRVVAGENMRKTLGNVC